MLDSQPDVHCSLGLLKSSNEKRPSRLLRIFEVPSKNVRGDFHSVLSAQAALTMSLRRMSVLHTEFSFLLTLSVFKGKRSHGVNERVNKIQKLCMKCSLLLLRNTEIRRNLLLLHTHEHFLHLFSAQPYYSTVVLQSTIHHNSDILSFS